MTIEYNQRLHWHFDFTFAPRGSGSVAISFAIVLEKILLCLVNKFYNQT